MIVADFRYTNHASICFHASLYGKQCFYNAQYAPIDVETFHLSHDRFLCIDDDVYHIGASIKDLGKKWFGFSKMEILSPEELAERINQG